MRAWDNDGYPNVTYRTRFGSSWLARRRSTSIPPTTPCQSQHHSREACEQGVRRCWATGGVVSANVVFAHPGREPHTSSRQPVTMVGASHARRRGTQRGRSRNMPSRGSSRVPYDGPVPVIAAGGAYGEPAPLRIRPVSAHSGASCGFRYRCSFVLAAGAGNTLLGSSCVCRGPLTASELRR